MSAFGTVVTPSLIYLSLTINHLQNYNHLKIFVQKYILRYTRPHLPWRFVPLSQIFHQIIRKIIHCKTWWKKFGLPSQFGCATRSLLPVRLDMYSHPVSCYPSLLLSGAMRHLSLGICVWRLRGSQCTVQCHFVLTLHISHKSHCTFSYKFTQFVTKKKQYRTTPLNKSRHTRRTANY